MASGLVPLVAGGFIDRALGGHVRWRKLAAVTAAGLIGTVWIAPAVLGETLFPWTRTAKDPQGARVCLDDTALHDLAILPRGTVLAPVFMGPAILLNTPHSVVAAPYHRAELEGFRIAVNPHHPGHGVGIGDPDCVVTQQPGSADELLRVRSPAEKRKATPQSQLDEGRRRRRVEFTGIDLDLGPGRSERNVRHQANSPCRNHCGSPPRPSPKRP